MCKDTTVSQSIISITVYIVFNCREGHLEVVKYLKKAQQCNMENADGEGQTPLQVACR